MKYIQEGQLELANQEDTKAFLVEVGEMARSVWLSQAEERSSKMRKA